MLGESIENALNRNLCASPRARELCAELAGRAVAVEILGTPLRFTLESLGPSLRLTRAAPHEPLQPVEATVSGRPLGLLQLAGAAPEAVIQRGEVRIAGDAELAQRYRELLQLLRPDAEEELARVLGDPAAHQLARAAGLALGWSRRAADTSVRNVAEYLAHERSDLVPRAEGEQFLRGVDRLREDADRLEARLALLERAGPEPRP